MTKLYSARSLILQRPYSSKKTGIQIQEGENVTERSSLQDFTPPMNVTWT